MSVKGIEFIVKNHFIEKIPSPYGLTGEFHRAFKKQNQFYTNL